MKQDWFRSRVGLLVNGEMRRGRLIERQPLYPINLSAMSVGADGPYMVRVWLDGEPQPMQQMVDEASLAHY